MISFLSSRSFRIFAFVFFSNILFSYSQCNVSVSVTDNGDGTSTLYAVATGASTNGSDSFSFFWDNGTSGDQITVNNDGLTYCVTMYDDYTEQVEVSAGYWVYDGYYDYYGYWIDTSYYVDPVYADQPQNCSSSDCGTVGTIDCSSTNVSIVETIPGQLDAIATGNGSISYLWTPNGETTQSINTVSGTTNYGVTITDSNGCTASDSYTSVDCSSTNVSIVETIPGQLDAIAVGNGSISYLWTPNGETTQSINTVSGTTNYGVTITDSNGCTASDTYVTSDCSNTNVSISETNYAQLDAIAVGNGSITYLWSPGGQTTQSINVMQSLTSYTVTITDGNGCTATDSYTTPDYCLNTEATITAVGSGQLHVTGATNDGNGNLYYSWSPTGETSQTINLTPGVTSYTITITDDFGCTATDIYNVFDCSNTQVTISETTPGQLDAIASGNGSISYLWTPNGETSQSINTVSGTTVYGVTITDGNGCTATDTYNTTDCSGTNVTISQTNQGQLDAIASGNGSISFLWSPNGETTQSIMTVSGVTVYSVTVTDGNGCTASDTYSVGDCSNTHVTISEYTPGQLDAIASGNGSISYLWSPNGETTQSINTSSSTTVYSVTVTDGNGCTATDSYTTTGNNCSSTHVSIVQTNPGQLDAIASGAATITYSWSPGNQTTQSINTTSTITGYTVKITDGNGCTATDTYSLSGNKPVANFNVSNSQPCKSQTISLTDASTNNPTSWQWSMPGGSPATSTLQNPSVSYNTTGTHNITLIATNGFGSSSAVSIQVVVNSTPSVSVLSQTICSGDLTILIATGANSYLWNNGYPFSIMPVTATTTTNYTVVGTTACGTVSATGHVTVKPNPTISVTSSTICPGSSATLTASGGTGYSWDTGSNSSVAIVSPSVTSTYVVTGSGSNGCTTDKTATVTVKPAPTLSVNSPTICVGKTATLTASGATTYHWNTGPNNASIMVTPSVTTVYTVTGTANTCSAAVNVTVDVQPLPVLSVISPTICVGSTATIVASGANTYSWNTGSTNSNLVVTPTVNTNYTVTGISSFGCVKTSTAHVMIGTAPVITAVSPTVCAGTPTILTANGVTSYTWSTGANTNSISITPTSTAIYTVSGNLTGCGTSATKTITVTVKPKPTTSVSSPTLCSAVSTTLLASGAATYSWSTGANSVSIVVSPTSTTVYTVTGIGTNGCSSPANSTITVKTTPSITVSSPTICAGKTLTLSATNGTTYLWSNGATTNSIVVTPTTNTTYTVIANNNGCVASKIVTVAPQPNLTVVSPTICTSATATLSANGASTYTWSNGNIANPITVTPSVTTVYTVTGAGLNGCTKTLTTSVTVSSSPGISVSAATICAGSPTVLTANGVTTYTWNTGVNTNTLAVSPTITTVYTVMGKLIGCTGTAVSSTTVSVNPRPTVSLTPLTSTAVCTLDPIINLVGLPSGGSYSGVGVFGNAFSPTISGPGVHVLAYTYTNTNGCSASSSRTITVNTCLGIEEYGLDELSIYPNPTRGDVNVVFVNSLMEHTSLQVYSSTGQLVIDREITEKVSSFNLQTLSNGIYFIRIKTNKMHLVKKIIKEN